MVNYPDRLPAQDSAFIPQATQAEGEALIPGKPSDRNIPPMRASSSLGERGDEGQAREIVARVGSFPNSPGPLSGQEVTELKKADPNILRGEREGANVLPDQNVQKNEVYYKEKAQYDSERGKLGESHLPVASGVAGQIIGRDVQDLYFKATRPNDPDTSAWDGSDPMGVGDDPDSPELQGSLEENATTPDIDATVDFPAGMDVPVEDKL